MVDIQCKDGKYIIDARIHSEIDKLKKTQHSLFIK